MATTKKLVTLENLSSFLTGVRAEITAAEAKSLHTGAVVGDTVYLFTEETVPMSGEDVDTSKAKFHFDISSSDITEIKATLAGYSSTNTVATAVADAKKAGTDAATAVSTLDGSLKAVAKSGAAADVSVADASDKLTATTVEAALLEIVNKADTNATAISTLNGADTVTGSVAKAVKDLKESLDYTDTAVSKQFVTKVSETDGVIAVERAALTADDIPTLTLSKISDAGTAAAKDVATAAIVEDTTDASLVTSAQVAKFVQDEVADLEGATHFRGVFDKLEDVTDPENGDIAIVGVKEYIYSKPGTEAGVWKELGDETIYVTKATTIAGVDLENNITKDEMLTALNVADGAQVNVLEGVQVNGADLTITDKKVNVTVATGATDGTVAVNGTDVAVKGLASAAYTESTAYDAAGTAQTKIEALDATVTNVTVEDANPVVAVSVTETDGKLTALTVNVVMADATDISNLFKTE